MPVPASAPQSAAPSSRVRSRLVAGALAIVAVLTLLTLWFGWSAVSTPVWWDRARPTSPAAGASATASVGLALENGITAALHAPRTPGETWTVALKQSDLNAWFDERLTRWLRNREIDLPEGWSVPRARFSGTRLSIVSRLDQPGRAPRYIGVSALLRSPSSSADDASPHTSQQTGQQAGQQAEEKAGQQTGGLRIASPRLIIGQLSIPVAAAPGFSGWLTELLISAGMDPPAASDLTSALLGERDLPAHATLQDGRTLRLLSIAPGGSADQPALLITCQTLPAPHSP